jgi:small subunit ribosomal protein S6
MREYELMFIVDPRLSDEEVVEVTDHYKAMIETSGGEVYKEESWGKRKLAYQIDKLGEGNYALFYIRSEDGSQFHEVEQRMSQNEKVLRYLTVRTDAGRLRYRGEAKEEVQAEEPTTEAPSENDKETG